MLTGTQGAALGVQRAKRAGLNIVLGRLGSAQIQGQPGALPVKYTVFVCRSGMPLRSHTLTECDMGCNANAAAG
jgi:hypothetical protein